MAAKSEIGLVGLAVMGQVRMSRALTVSAARLTAHCQSWLTETLLP